MVYVLDYFCPQITVTLKHKLTFWLNAIEKDEPIADKNSAVKVFAITLALFAILVTGRLHGFSISCWHRFIDGSKPSEVVLGKPQEVRSDDWLLDLSLTFAQVESDFPKFNDKIGIGQAMTFPIKTPVMGFIAVFRPALWGFFFSKDIGLAWNWWFLVLGLFLSSYFFFRVLSNGRHTLSWLAAIAFTTAPYWQLWSYHYAEVVIHGLLAATALTWLLTEQRTLWRWLWSIVLAHSTIAFVVDVLYPPMIVSCGWALLLICISLCFVRSSTFKVHQKRLFLVITAVFSVLCIIFILTQEGDSLRLISNTVYPGRRVSTGGGLSPLLLFGTHYFSLGKLSGNVGNICEAAGFFFFFPAILGTLLFKKQSESSRLLPFVIGAFLLATIWFSYLGIPEWLAKATLMSRVTSNRTMASLGIAEMSLLVYFAAHFSISKWSKPFKRGILTGIFCIATTGIIMRHTPEGLPLWSILGISTLHALLASFLLEGRRFFFLLLIAMNLAYAGHFNPLTRGGSEFLENNELTREIRKANSSNNVWLVYGLSNADSDRVKALSNFLPMIGVHSLGGYHTHPQFELWRHFDPERKQVNLYNMCARAMFMASKQRLQNSEVIFEQVPGQLTVRASLENPALRSLNVSRILVVANDFEEFDVPRGFLLMKELLGTRIYGKE